MKFFPRRHTPESVAAELIEGLENGTITLDGNDSIAAARDGQPEARVPKLEPELLMSHMSAPTRRSPFRLTISVLFFVAAVGPIVGLAATALSLARILGAGETGPVTPNTLATVLLTQALTLGISLLSLLAATILAAREREREIRDRERAWLTLFAQRSRAMPPDTDAPGSPTAP